jgi:hypothetical protein
MNVTRGGLEDYLSSNGLRKIPFQKVDQAWGYRENEPVFAFIHDPSDGSTSFQNAISLYWATAEYISRPWCLVFSTETPMMSHHNQMLQKLAAQYRIIVHESPSDEALLKSVNAQLSDLTRIMARYIDSNAENPLVSLGGSINEWKEKKPVLEEVTEVEIILGDLSQYEENGVLAPSRTTVPLSVQSGKALIEGVLPRLIQVDPVIFYTEHRNLPIVFKLDICEGTFTSRFEADKSNLIEATNYESLITAFKSSGEVSFIDQNTGKNLFDLSVIR